ncbi:hypothetical protein F5B20DRAFT_540102 [Whalleya microplaca]|nr:hypothetical protein F5B20DRAFT_540102 [Whalleya microplaca]
MPEAHVAEGRCAECQGIATANVDAYMRTVVIPQLQALRAGETGLDGFVLPPPRIEQSDAREVWLPKRAPESDAYVFCHGDLAQHNIMADPASLELMCIYDWEGAGYFPAAIELPLWRCNHSEYLALFTDKAKLDEEVMLIQ